MRKITALVMIAVFLSAVTLPAFAAKKSIYAPKKTVSSYKKKNGTTVKSHKRR